MSIKLPPVAQVARPVMRAVYEIATPMYLHDADPAKLVQRITPQSVKGALRFWWRAVHWGDYLHVAGGDRSRALQALAEADARLWGAADESIGQGRVLIQVRSEKLKRLQAQVPIYLKGMGLRNAKEALKPGQTFSLTVYFKSEGERLAQDQMQVQRALQALGVFGGLGSRARHGLGSVQLRQLDEAQFDSWQAHKRVVESLLRHGQRVEGWPPYTAFSSKTRAYFIQGDNEREVLNAIANSLSEYRRFHFTADADAVLTVANGGTPPANYPKRAVFGLPHNYFFGESRTNVQVDGWYAPEKEKLRRASPLFIHVSHFKGGAVGLLTLFEADFLPGDREGRQYLAVQGNRNRKYPSFVPDWRVISDFLMHELQNAERIKP